MNSTPEITPARRSITQPLSDPAASSSIRMPRVARGTQPPTAKVPALEQDPSAGVFAQPLAQKWGRRVLTIPGCALLAALWTAALVVTLPYGALSDLLRGRRQLLVRFHLLIASVLCWQVVGVLGLTVIYLIFPPFLVQAATWREVNRRFEVWWVIRALGIPEVLYGAHFEVEGLECARPGPILLFSRHASIVDTILPIKLLGGGLNMTMRIVKKRELLNVPGVDIISHRLPRTFVRRGSGNPERERGMVQNLLAGIGERDAVVIFPEGSRFTKEKQEQVVSKLRERNPQAAERALELETVLPIRPHGALALLESRPDIDIVFVAHTGLEGANRLDDFVGGALLDRTIRVKMWRVKAASIPAGNEERLAWLHEQWKQVDRWIAENRDADLA